MRGINFGLIGCGLIGREFASALLRWRHLLDMPARTELVAICDRFVPNCSEKARWFTENFPPVYQVTTNHKELPANREVGAVYRAVPHNVHQKFYCAVSNAANRLIDEKPFGMDLPAQRAILARSGKHTELLVRYSSDARAVYRRLGVSSEIPSRRTCIGKRRKAA